MRAGRNQLDQSRKMDGRHSVLDRSSDERDFSLSTDSSNMTPRIARIRTSFLVFINSFRLDRDNCADYDIGCFWTDYVWRPTGILLS